MVKNIQYVQDETSDEPVASEKTNPNLSYKPPQFTQQI